MGALFFFLAFVLLIPVCAIGVDVLGSLGFLGDMSDPEEWDDEDE